MKTNTGIADRMIRILIAALIAILYLTNVISGTLAIVLLGIAAIFLVTGFIGTCPIYLALGFSTAPKPDLK